MQLKSDFNDWYDYAFNKSGPVFERYAKTTRTRKEDLEFLQSIGFKVPRYGKVKDLAKQITEYCVVYVDETAHCGEGKLKLNLKEALEKYPEHFATEYIMFYEGNRISPCSVSYRYLFVGNKVFLLKYESNHDWRSNVGDGETKVLVYFRNSGYYPGINVPMCAIDFILSRDYKYAIDYNIAPGLEPLKDIISAGEIVDLLQQAMVDFKIIS